MSHRTPAAAALRLTGERSGTAAMPSARAFANIKHIEQAFGWIKTSRGARVRPLAHRRDGGHGDFLDHVEEGRLTFQGKFLGQVRWRIPFWGSQGLPGHALQIGLRRVLILLRARSAGSFSTRRRAAKYPHPGILSLRHLPSHCDERLAHEYDIGRRARYRNDARSRRGPNGVARIGDA